MKKEKEVFTNFVSYDKNGHKVKGVIIEEDEIMKELEPDYDGYGVTLFFDENKKS